MYKKLSVPNVIRLDSIVNIYRQNIDDRQSNGRGESHSFWEFLYLESGHLRVLVDGNLYSISPGELILYPPHAFHCVAASSGTTACNVSFDTNSPALLNQTGQVLMLSHSAQEDFARILSMSKRVLSLKDTEADRATLLRDNATQADIQRLANHLELFLLELCNTETRSNNKNFRNEQFAAFHDYLKKNMDKNLTLENISDGCAVSVAKLQKLCRDYCGCGPVTYFISLKIGAAKQMMKDSSLNITQISDRLGFSSVHYFSRLFKEKTGMTPSEFAKSAYKN